MDFNPNSSDAIFATILERLGKQDVVLARIDIQTTKTNGRVTAIETSRATEKAVSKRTIAIVAGVASTIGTAIGWIAESGFHHLP